MLRNGFWLTLCAGGSRIERRSPPEPTHQPVSELTQESCVVILLSLVLSARRKSDRETPSERRVRKAKEAEDARLNSADPDSVYCHTISNIAMPSQAISYFATPSQRILPYHLLTLITCIRPPQLCRPCLRSFPDYLPCSSSLSPPEPGEVINLISCHRVLLTRKGIREGIRVPTLIPCLLC